MASTRSTRRDGGRQISGVFDVRAAWKVEEVIERAPPDEVLTLDFTRVREYEEFGIAVLAQALKHRRTARVALRGLGEPEIRLLQSFGVSGRSAGVRLVCQDA